MAKEFILPFSELKATLDDTPIEPTLEITENGVYNVKGYVYADVNVEGGGGSSDFSTLEVTLVLTAPEGVNIVYKGLEEAGIDYPSAELGYYTNFFEIPTDNPTINILCYKNKASFRGINGYDDEDNGYEVNLSDATFEGDGYYDDVNAKVVITGNCTITAEFVGGGD